MLGEWCGPNRLYQLCLPKLLPGSIRIPSALGIPFFALELLNQGKQILYLADATNARFLTRLGCLTKTWCAARIWSLTFASKKPAEKFCCCPILLATTIREPRLRRFSSIMC